MEKALCRDERDLSIMNVKPFTMPIFSRETPGARRETIDVEKIRQAAYQEGFRQGETDGLARGEKTAAVLIEKIGHIIEELTRLKAATLRELEPQVVNLAVQIARRVVMKELQTDENLIVELTREALKRLDRSGLITITVSPQLYDLFVRHKPSLLNIHPEIAFEVDPSSSTLTAIVSSASEEIMLDADGLLGNVTRESRESRAGH